MRISVFDIENWKEIGSTLARNKTRTFLTGFGIFWGVAILAILLGGAQGAQDILRRNFAGMATNVGAVVPSMTTMPYRGNAKGRTWRVDLTDIERLRLAIPEIELVIPVFQSWGDASCRNGKYSYAGSATGTGPEYQEMNRPLMYAGRFINAADESQERKVVVLGKKIADEIFPGIKDPTGRTVQVNGITYSIVGVAGNLGESSINGPIDEKVMMPTTTFRKAFNRADKADFIIFSARPGIKISDILPKVRATLYRRHNVNPLDEDAVWSIDISEMFGRINGLFMGLSILALFIGVSTLLAGVIGIGNIMWVIVKERTQEIGIRRAIGAKPGDIVAQVLSEGVALTVVAGIAGIVFAALVLGLCDFAFNQNLADTSLRASFQMSFGRAMLIVLTFVVLGSAAGLIPAIKAMRIKPIEALNDK